MSTFATDFFTLSGQILSATGNQLYLDGLLIGSGVFSSSAQATGQTLYNDLTGLSGVMNQGSLSGLAATVSGNIASSRMTRFQWAYGASTISFASLKTFFGTTGIAPGPGGISGFNSATTFIDLAPYTGVRLIVGYLRNPPTTGAMFIGYCNTGYSIYPNDYNFIDTNKTFTYFNANAAVAINSGFLPIVAAARSGVYVGLFFQSGKAGAFGFGQVYMDLM
jgi:hypothetical protein